MKESFQEKIKLIGEYSVDPDKRIIYVSGVLTEEIATELRLKYALIKAWWSDVKNEKFNDITLDISSFGGSIYAINAALDFYYGLEKEDGVLVNTKTQSICMSAATVLVAGATGTRTASPRCKFMLHDVQVEGMGGTANQVAHSAKNLAEEQMDMFKLYAQFSRRGKEIFTEKELATEAKKWHKRFTKDGYDFYISSDEVLKLNLIDSII